MSKQAPLLAGATVQQSQEMGDPSSSYRVMDDDRAGASPYNGGDPYSRAGEEYEETRSIFFVLFYQVMRPLLALAHTKKLVQGDLVPLQKGDLAFSTYERFRRRWEQQRRRRNPSLFRCLARVHGLRFGSSVLAFTYYGATLFMNPFYVVWICNNLEDAGGSAAAGYLLATLMFCNTASGSICMAYGGHESYRIGAHVKSSLIQAVYRKSFQVSNAVRNTISIGEMTNLMSIDAQVFADMMVLVNWFFLTPLVFVVAFTILYLVNGWPSLVGMLIVFPIVAVNMTIVRLSVKLQRGRIGISDKRVKAMSECIMGIRVVKQYAWEESMVEKILNLRSGEVSRLRRFVILKSFSNALMEFLAPGVTATIFITMAAAGMELNVDDVVTTIAIVNVIRLPVTTLPLILSAFVMFHVSLGRLQRFLLADELSTEGITHTVPTAREREAGQGCIIHIRDGNFYWEKGTPCLQDVNLLVNHGETVCVVGRVGCGRSSLLLSALGEMERASGTVQVTGSIAFCTQVAWIQNATVRDNILFGKPYDETWYRKVLYACALERDLEILEAGDQTEIGERGINLSGGQKQRVALARAVYTCADVYLLDDVLSAVDAHVGKHIFDNCIDGLLKHKTVLFVTNQLQYLKSVDRVCLMTAGRVVNVETYDALMAGSPEFKSLLEEYEGEQQSQASAAAEAEAAEEAKDEETKAEEAAAAEERKAGGKDVDLNRAKGTSLMSQEERATGTVALGVYKRYYEALGSFKMNVTFTLVLTGLLMRIGGDFWIGTVWATDQYEESDGYYAGVYIAIICVYVFANFTSCYGFAITGVGAGAAIFRRMLTTLFRAPMKFYDATPVGRIINRCSRDTELIDALLPTNVQAASQTNCFIALVLGVICITFPLFLLFLVPLAWVYLRVTTHYRSCARDCQRLESVSRSPIFARFSESLNGLGTIRAYKAVDRFIATVSERTDDNITAYWTLRLGERWLSVHLELLSALVTYITAILSLLMRDFQQFDTEEEREVYAGEAAVTLVYAMQMAFLLNWGVRQMTELETRMNSVERVLHYADMEREPEPVNPSYRPPPGWPTRGEIVLRDVTMRYRSDMPLVLNGVNLHIAPNTKLGIVGRTGSGKSTLFVALLRLVDIEGGSITIDGMDIHRLGLKDLRSNLTIIPQDPVLFSQDVRFNLDPFNQATDEACWRALEAVQLKEAIQELEGGLQAPVAENGENFSVGQRQLFCIARALLRRPRVLFLDEATASVDHETDGVIQQVIRAQFADCTVLTVAHRLNTVLDSDVILVMDAGVVAEYAPPDELANNPNSVFAGMLRDAAH